MIMLVIPTQPIPSQVIQVTLGNQATVLNVYQKYYGLFMDVYLDTTLIIGGVLCHNANYTVGNLYLGYSGDFSFIDNQGSLDPSYPSLGTRFSLIYFDSTELNYG
jgi:hypothetical protein